MKISEAEKFLEKIKNKYGDIDMTFILTLPLANKDSTTMSFNLFDNKDFDYFVFSGIGIETEVIFNIKEDRMEGFWERHFKTLQEFYNMSDKEQIDTLKVYEKVLDKER